MRTDLLEGGPVKRLVLVMALIGALGVGFVVVDTYFLPEDSTVVNEAPPATGATEVTAGTFSGKAGHRVTGTVALERDEEGYFLRFEDYRQTQGPDVYVYLTPSEDPDTASEISAGRKILIDGGADGGESTKEGTFVQRLPADIDVERYNGVAIWCDQFSVPFGAAALN